MNLIKCEVNVCVSDIPLSPDTADPSAVQCAGHSQVHEILVTTEKYDQSYLLLGCTLR